MHDNNVKHDDHIQPCTTKPFNIDMNAFCKLFENVVCKLMNTCNHHECNPRCYKSYVNPSKKFVDLKFSSTFNQ